MTKTILLVDDQMLFLKSLSMLIDSLTSFVVVGDAINGEDAIRKLSQMDHRPDLVLLDVEMPIMSGEQTVRAILKSYPGLKVVALSMNDDDRSIIRMIRAGCCAYLVKDIHPLELEKALNEVFSVGYYNGDKTNINFRRLIAAGIEEDKDALITERERSFLQLASSDLTYKEIAVSMHLSERTIDGYRETLFGKLNVQSRVGMAMEAVRRELIKL